MVKKKRETQEYGTCVDCRKRKKAENPEAFLEERRQYMREYYQKNKEKFREYQKQFKGKNPGYYKEYYQKKIKGRPKPPDNSETD